MKINGLEDADFGMRRMDDLYDVKAAKQKLKILWMDEMSHVHITARGRQIALYDMDDDHLINTLNYHARNIGQAIRESTDFTGPRSMLDAIMTGTRDDREEKVQTAKGIISDSYQILGRYVVEALRRGLVEKTLGALSEYYTSMNGLAEIDVDGQKIQIEDKSDA